MSKSAEAFRTISEVADLLETPTHVLRFWESKFPQIKPVKRAGGRRYYRPADVALLSGIKRLLHDDGMTIRGVQKLIKEQGAKQISEGFELEEEGAAAERTAHSPPGSAPSVPTAAGAWQEAPTLETTSFAAPAEALEPAPDAPGEPAPPLAEEVPLAERLAQHAAEDLPEAGPPQQAPWEEPAAAFESSGIAAPAEALDPPKALPTAPVPAWEPPAAFESTSFPAPAEALEPPPDPCPEPAPLPDEAPLAERLAQHPAEELAEACAPQQEPWQEPGAAFESSGIAAPAEALEPEGAAAEPPAPTPAAEPAAPPPPAPRRGIWRQPSLFDPPEAEAEPEALIEIEAVVVEITTAKSAPKPPAAPVPEAPIALDVAPEEPDPLARVVSLIIGGAAPVSAPLAQADQIDPRDDPLARMRRDLPRLDAGALSPIARMRLLSAHDRLVALRARLGQPPRPPRG